MTRAVVADASALVALLLDDGPEGRWVAKELAGLDLLAPQLLPFEVVNVLRRLERARVVGADQAAQAHADLLELPIAYYPYEALAPRVWELRANLSTHDASYVALAEATSTELVTLDRRIARAPALACAVVTP